MQITKTSPLAITSLVTALAGAGVQIYLAQQHVITKYTMDEGSALCNVSEYLNCGTAIASKYSEFLGTPIALFGLVTNLIILYFTLRFLFLDTDEKQEHSASTALSFSAFSFSASLVMAGISFGILKSLCPFCAAAYVLSFINVVTLYAIVRRGFGRIPAFDLKTLASAFAVLLVASFAFGKVSLNKYNSRDFRQLTDLRVQKWQAETEKQIELVAPQIKGPPSAKMKIVEFADFLCHHCKMAYPKLHTFAKSHSSDVQVIFQNWPLDGCAGPAETPGRRCELAMVNYCSEKQNKGFQAQDYLFTNQEAFGTTPELKPELEKMYTSLSLNAAQMEQCLKDPQSLAAIKGQVELGKKLGVGATPSFFINNKAFSGGAHIPSLQQVYNTIQVDAIIQPSVKQ